MRLKLHNSKHFQAWDRSLCSVHRALCCLCSVHSVFCCVLYTVCCVACVLHTVCRVVCVLYTVCCIVCVLYTVCCFVCILYTVCTDISSDPTRCFPSTGIRCTAFYSLWARAQNCEKRLLASSRPSVRTEQRGSHWTDFDETWYLRLSKICRENLNIIKIRQK
jgi:hypothetical protein